MRRDRVQRPLYKQEQPFNALGKTLMGLARLRWQAADPNIMDREKKHNKLSEQEKVYIGPRDILFHEN